MARPPAETSTASDRSNVLWHAVEAGVAIDRLGSTPQGLGADEVAARRKTFGPNVLPARVPPTLAAILLHQFLSPLIYILIAAAAVAVAMQDYVDAWFILAVVFLNAGLGGFQEWKAEQSASALQQMLKVQVRVRREGTEQQLSAENLVPGDVVLLESGNRVPADLRLLRANNLRIDESFLTGESLPVEKQTAAVEPEAPVSERLCLGFAGSTVMSGRGEGVVVAIGLRTEVGAIAETVTAAASTKPPLVVRMEAFARQISLAVLGVCILLAIVALARGMAYADVFFMAVALAVSAIPEGLPVAITVALSIATTRMARRNVIVRRLAAVEGLGSCTFIASDKTGTLTVNQQTVREIALPTGQVLKVTGSAYEGDGDVSSGDGESLSGDSREGLDRLVTAGALCNEATLARTADGWAHHGDAVDVALLALAYKAGLDAEVIRRSAPVAGAIPFESERGYAATFVEHGGRIRVAVKGALEVLLPRCRTMAAPGGTAEIDEAFIEKQALEMAKSGHRFLVIADGDVANAVGGEPFGEERLPDLTLLGLVGLIDPARLEARPAVQKCQRAGIEVAMVTGDHPMTALSIARDLEIAKDQSQVVTGAQLESLGEAASSAFDRAVAGGRVFARVSPMQKLQIVESLQRQGHFVAVTGDGVNDAPALKIGNIGVAMGSGSDVTRDTASLIVTDDNFASIEAGVEEGRFAYDNIRKVTYLLISTGAAEVVLFILALFAGLPLPLLPVQLLWLNLVTNGIQDIALAFEGGEPGAMQRKPRRPTEGIINPLMIQQTVVSGLTMGLVAFATWAVLLGMGVEEAASRNRVLLLMVLLQNYHVFNCRSEYESVFSVPLKRNYLLVFGVVIAQGIHLLAMHVPVMERILQIDTVAWNEWGGAFLLAAVILVVMEVFKVVVRRRR